MSWSGRARQQQTADTATKKKSKPKRPRACPGCGAAKAIPGSAKAGTMCLSCEVQTKGGGLW